jgi:hypothetical protein
MKNFIIAVRASSGPALCNAGQHYPKKEMIYTILTHSTGSDLFMYISGSSFYYLRRGAEFYQVDHLLNKIYR